MIEVLEKIKNDFGVDILHEPQKVKSLVADLQPNDKKLLRRITMFYDSGAATDIIKNIDSPEVAFGRAVLKFCDYTDASEEVAKEIMVSFFRVLEIDSTFVINKIKNNKFASSAKTNKAQTNDNLLSVERKSEIQSYGIRSEYLKQEIIDLSLELKNISSQYNTVERELQTLGAFSFKRKKEMSEKLSNLLIYKEEIESKIKEKKRHYSAVKNSDNSSYHNHFNTSSTTHMQSTNANHINQTANNNTIPTSDNTARTISTIVQIVRTMEALDRQEKERAAYNNLDSQREKIFNQKTAINMQVDNYNKQAKAYYKQMNTDTSILISGYIRSNFIEVSKLLERCDHNDCRYHWMVFCIYKQFLLYINDYIDETQIYDAYETAMSLAPDYLKYRFRKEQTKNNPDFEFLIFNQEKLKREYENSK